MATQNDVRRIALALAGAQEDPGRFGFSVLVKGKAKGFVWAWQERLDPKKPRVSSREVIAVRVSGLDAKDALLAAAPDKFFTEPHYQGYPAVLVRLREVTVAELRELLGEAWRCRAEPNKPARRRASGAGARPTEKERRR
jgi:hypothetical protein